MKLDKAISNDTIIQIDLYSYAVLTKELIIKTIIILVMVILMSCLFLRFVLIVDNALMYVIVIAISMLLTVFIRLFQYLFLPIDKTLIIAFNELQVLKENQILWRNSINDICTKKYYHELTNTSIVQIEGQHFQTMIIGCHQSEKNWQKPLQKNKIDYMIYSKSDWQLIKKYLLK